MREIYLQWMDYGSRALRITCCYRYGVPSAAVHSNGPGLPLPGPDVEVDLPKSPRNVVYR